MQIPRSGRGMYFLETLNVKMGFWLALACLEVCSVDRRDVSSKFKSLGMNHRPFQIDFDSREATWNFV